MPLYCDNDAAVRIAEDSVLHSNTKHFRVKLHYVCDQVRMGELNILRVPSADNVADILTKSLNRTAFESLRLSLRLRTAEVTP